MASEYSDQQYCDYVAAHIATQSDTDTGDIEIDSDALVSSNDSVNCSHGAYVQVWTWVNDESMHNAGFRS